MSRPNSGVSICWTTSIPSRARASPGSQTRIGSTFPFASIWPSSPKVIARSVALKVVSSTRIPLTGAAAWSRAAVFTTSPDAIPWPASGLASSDTSASPVVIPIRTSSSPCSSAQSRMASAARTARSASSSCATGAPNRAMTASPMNFSTVPPKRFELGAEPLVVRPENRLHVLGIERLRARGESDEVGEEHRHHLPFPTSCVHAVAASSASPASMYRVAPTER